MLSIANRYIYYIHEIYKNLTNKENIDLCKIFEYYVCIKLTQEYQQDFFEYSDISPEFKEQNKMSKSDTGIDCSNLIDTIVQCKLRKNIGWTNVSTFLASNIILEEEELKIKWKKMILARNDDSILSDHLTKKSNLLIQKLYNKEQLIEYCDNIQLPLLEVDNEPFKLRDYQEESIQLIKDSKNNVTICLPTGTGKNVVIIFSIDITKKNLILVPMRILTQQLYDEIMKHKKEYKNQIQIIGDGNNKYDKNKKITICVYNSIELITDIEDYHKIYIDEAHHINKPEIYEEDEEKEDTFINKIQELEKYNNNVLLSATIDNVDYKKDIRDMIEKDYLSDYSINIPIFTGNNNETICRYLIQNHMYIIIYCNSQEEGKKINEIMNKIQDGSSKYIDANTNKTDRKKIIYDFKLGFIPFLVNVRVLTEGFDAPITRGVCFLHIPTSGTKIIQVVGRALRKHPLKNIAKVILPYSTEDNEKTITNFIKTIAKNDRRIRKTYENKDIGGYIDIINTNEEEMEEYELMYEKIYDGFGNLMNYEEIWNQNLEKLIKFINENKKRPVEKKGTGYEKKLSTWLFRTNRNYKNRIDIMKYEKIRIKWEIFLEEYKEYLLNNVEKWYLNFSKIKSYINEYKTLSNLMKNDKKLLYWLDHTKKYYKKNEYIMSNIEVRKEWEIFVNENKELFLNSEEIWYNKFNKLKDYIHKNNKLPHRTSNDKDIQKLAYWLKDSKENYKKNVEIMKNIEIRKDWEIFLEKYKELLFDNYEKWYNNFNKLKEYIKKYNSLPNIKEKLSKWYYNQKHSYKNKKNLMKNENIKKEWEKFLEEFKQYL
tara:strand:+ start:8174 stop:10645 length:2472 start_codon:yes stop_codon:yes gene_type:complete